MSTKLEKLLVTFPELREIGIRYSRGHLNRLIGTGDFPKPLRLGSGEQSAKAYWRLADITGWINKRAVAAGCEAADSKPSPSDCGLQQLV